jgi:hypothetical protein
MKQFFLFLLLSVTTFAVAQEDLSVSVIDFNTQNHLLMEISLVNSSVIVVPNKYQISKVKLPLKEFLLDGYQVIFEGTAVYAAQKSDLISVRSNQAPMFHWY